MSKQDFAFLIFNPSCEKSEYSFTNPEVYYEYASPKGLIECSLDYVNSNLKTRINQVSIFNIFDGLAKDDEIFVNVKMKLYEYGKTYKTSFIVNGWELLDMKIGTPNDNFNIIFNQNMNVLYDKIPS